MLKRSYRKQIANDPCHWFLPAIETLLLEKTTIINLAQA